MPYRDREFGRMPFGERLRGTPGIWLRRILVLVVVGWGLAWLTASLVIPNIVRRAIPELAVKAQEMGVDLTDFSFSSINVSPFLNRVSVHGLKTAFDLRPDDDKDLNSQVEMKVMSVGLSNPFSMRGSLHAEGLEVRLDDSDLPPSLPFDRFTNGNVTLPDFPLAEPKVAAREILEGLKELFQENEVAGDFQFSGDVKIEIEHVSKTTRMYTERTSLGTRLRFDRADVEDLAEKMNVNLSMEQIDIVSMYPLRVPVLIVITDAARDRSIEHEPDDVWRQDAHRHVTWSYLLTKHFGPEFAKQVTDAHEMNPGNTDDERAMDFHNNAMGRRLFAQGVTELKLPERIGTDADIIRHPDEVAAMGNRLLH
ncbi:MAG: DUF6973 domain-containing protein [Pirellulaceae bacterium]